VEYALGAHKICQFSTGIFQTEATIA